MIFTPEAGLHINKLRVETTEFFLHFVLEIEKREILFRRFWSWRYFEVDDIGRVSHLVPGVTRLVSGRLP